MNIYTHDGTFHSDEVFAVAIIKKFIGGEINITRTRDDEILKNAKKDKHAFVIDVGGEYNEKYKNFDHHQRIFNTHWPDENILYSSCGLVWRYLKKKGYLKKIKKEVIHAIEDNLIKKIDMHDNGERKWPLSAMVSFCNKEDSQIEDFERAVEVASIFFDNVLYQEQQNEDKYIQFLEDLEEYNDNLQYFISHNTIKDARVLNKISNNTNALLLIYPQHDENNEESWMIKSVNRYDENGQTKNLLAPEKWRGLTGKTLQKVSGMKGLLFAHRTGFLIGIKTKNQAIKVAEYLISKHNHQEKAA